MESLFLSVCVCVCVCVGVGGVTDVMVIIIHSIYKVPAL